MFICIHHLALCTAEISHTDGQLESNSRAFTHLSPIGRGRRTRPRPGLIPRARGTNCPGFPSPEPWHAASGSDPVPEARGVRQRREWWDTDHCGSHAPPGLCAVRVSRTGGVRAARRGAVAARHGRPGRPGRARTPGCGGVPGPGHPPRLTHPTLAATAGETSHPSPLRRLRDRCAVGASRPVRDRILFTQRREGAAGRRHGLHPG